MSSTKRTTELSKVREIGNYTGAFILGMAHQRQVNQIQGCDGFGGGERESEEEDGESEGCDCPVSFGEFPPRKEKSKPRVRHLGWTKASTRLNLITARDDRDAATLQLHSALTRPWR